MEKTPTPLIHVRARLLGAGESVCVEVCDTGPGVPAHLTLVERFDVEPFPDFSAK